MSELQWLDLHTVLFIHVSAIQQAGGSQGVRDAGLLESALARPKSLHTYGESDFFQLAASYAQSIARNHPFVDGNKRTAFESASIFLLDNGRDLQQIKDNNHVEMMENLAQGKITKEEAGEYLKDHSEPVS